MQQCTFALTSLHPVPPIYSVSMYTHACTPLLCTVFNIKILLHSFIGTRSCQGFPDSGLVFVNDSTSCQGWVINCYLTNSERILMAILWYSPKLTNSSVSL